MTYFEIQQNSGWWHVLHQRQCVCDSNGLLVLLQRQYFMRRQCGQVLNICYYHTPVYFMRSYTFHMCQCCYSASCFLFLTTSQNWGKGYVVIQHGHSVELEVLFLLWFVLICSVWLSSNGSCLYKQTSRLDFRLCQ